MARDLISLDLGGEPASRLPALLSTDPATAERVLDFFTANIRNPNTRKAYARAVASFGTWCERHGISELRAVRPTHVATYIEELQATLAAPSIKLQLAAVRMLFDWLVVGQIVPTNPASAVRGPKHVVRKGKTPVLSAEETRELLDSIDTDTPAGLGDRALIALLVYTFARVGAAVKMRLEDVYPQGKRTWVRLHEKGGKRHDMPCHHALDGYLEAYLEHRSADRKAWLFPSLAGRTGEFTDQPMKPVDVWRMIRRRALAAGIPTAIGCHTFRATGITEYLRNGGMLEIVQQMANHESARTSILRLRTANHPFFEAAALSPGAKAQSVTSKYAQLTSSKRADTKSGTLADCGCREVRIALRSEAQSMQCSRFWRWRCNLEQ